jgi:hypothetical protein
MKQVLRHIFSRKRSYQLLPLFEWMRDEQLSARGRLAFYPCMAPFIMSFGDLNKFILREERPGDLHQEMVNAHTLEDDHHWPWYLEDFAKLGFDAELRGTAWMSFLWGEETQQSRVLMARLTALISGTTGTERLVIIEAIEETGNVLFGTMLPLATTVEQQLGLQLRYCGPFHFGLESGHAVGADHKALTSLSFSARERARSIDLVDEVFSAFEAWTYELLRYAQTHPLRTSASSAVWRIDGPVDGDVKAG